MSCRRQKQLLQTTPISLHRKVKNCFVSRDKESVKTLALISFKEANRSSTSRKENRPLRRIIKDINVPREGDD